MQKVQDTRLVVGIVLFIFMMTYIWFSTGTKEIGESCHGFGTWECKDGPCLTVTEDSFCTLASENCPVGSRSMVIDVTVKIGDRFKETKETYCIPARLVKSVKTGATGKMSSGR